MSKVPGRESWTWRGAGLLAALGLSSCVPIAVPPAKVDVGYGPYTSTRAPGVARGTESRPVPGVVKPPAPLDGKGVLRVAAGVHLASLLPSSTLPIDVGVGYVLNAFPGDDSRVLHGAYGEVSPIVVRRPDWRVTIGARGELIIASPSRLDDGYGLFGRVGVEVFRPVYGGGGHASGSSAIGGVAMGTLAAGLFLEAGAQRLPGGDVTRVAVLGVSFRTPVVLGVFCCAK